MKKLIIVSGLVGMVILGGCSAAPVKEESKPKVETAKPVVKEEKITKENYDKIIQGDSLTGKGGMTMEQVISILGEPDSKSESQSGDMKMTMVDWMNKDFQNISITFTNGRVSFKMFME